MYDSFHKEGNKFCFNESLAENKVDKPQTLNIPGPRNLKRKRGISQYSIKSASTITLRMKNSALNSVAPVKTLIQRQPYNFSRITRKTTNQKLQMSNTEARSDSYEATNDNALSAKSRIWWWCDTEVFYGAYEDWPIFRTCSQQYTLITVNSPKYKSCTT